MKDPSDKYLIKFLSKCGNVELYILLNMLKSRFSPASKKLSKRYPTEDDVPDAGSEQRANLAEEIANQLRWYGSNAFAYAWRRMVYKDGGVHYHKAVRDSAKAINNFRKKKARIQLPRVVSDEDWEDLICALLIQTAFKNKTSEKIATMLEEAGLEKEAALQAAKEFGPGTTAIALPILVKILGKKTIKIIIEEVIVKITERKLGKDAALKLAKRLLIKLPQKTIAKSLSIVGWILLALDTACFLASPARRITIPTVAFISISKYRERLINSE